MSEIKTTASDRDCRDAFAKTFGAPPGSVATAHRDSVATAHRDSVVTAYRDSVVTAYRDSVVVARRSDDFIAAQCIESPLGALLVAATRDAVCFLEFADRHPMEWYYQQMKKRFRLPILPESNTVLETLRAELERYFQGAQKNFTVRLALNGTPFQERVWQELQKIPYGETISYEQLARRIGQPTAVRAVARANGANRISIVIPCHRVIGKDGTLTGYGGGLWRKRLLLELEKMGRLPDDG